MRHIVARPPSRTAAVAKLIDDNRLGVSGCVAFICREQVWVRE